MRHLHHILLPTNLMGEGEGNTVGVKGQGGLLGIILSRHDKAVTPMNSEQLWLLTCIRTAQDQTSQNFRVNGEGLTEVLLAVNG